MEKKIDKNQKKTRAKISKKEPKNNQTPSKNNQIAVENNKAKVENKQVMAKNNPTKIENNQATAKNKQTMAKDEQVTVENKQSTTKNKQTITNGRRTAIRQVGQKLEASLDTSFQDTAKTTESILKNYIRGDRSVCDIVLANLIVLFAVFLSMFLPVVNFALPVLLLLYFEVGLFGFIYKGEMEEKARFEDLFVSIKKIIKIFCLFVLKMVLILFWTCVLIVPGIICMLNYCFTSLILFEEHNIDAKGVLLLSKELVKGHRWTIFFYMLFALASICVAMMLMFFIILIFDLFLDVPAVYYIVFVLLAGVFDLVLMAIPLVEVAIVDAYMEAKKEKTGK